MVHSKFTFNYLFIKLSTPQLILSSVLTKFTKLFDFVGITAEKQSPDMHHGDIFRPTWGCWYISTYWVHPRFPTRLSQHTLQIIHWTLSRIYSVFNACNQPETSYPWSPACIICRRFSLVGNVCLILLHHCFLLGYYASITSITMTNKEAKE